MKFNLPRPKSWGWLAASILLGIWVICQIIGWYFALRANRIERQLTALRPTLSAIVLSDQLEKSVELCAQTFGEIAQLDLGGSSFLARLSGKLPASVWLEKLDVQPLMGIKVRGAFIPGIRPPEEVLALWAADLQEAGYQVEVKRLSPDPKNPALWHFDMKAK